MIRTAAWIFCSICSIWDGATTFFAIADIIGGINNFFQLMVSLVVTFGISGILFMTYPIVKSDHDFKFLGVIALLFAVGYDFYTCFTGTMTFIHGDFGDGGKVAIGIITTFICCASTICLSVLYFDKDVLN